MVSLKRKKVDCYLNMYTGSVVHFLEDSIQMEGSALLEIGRLCIGGIGWTSSAIDV